MKRFYSILVLMAAVFSATAQNNIEGRIVDELGDPVPGASVWIKQTNKGTSTNANGYFVLENVKEGKHTLVTTFIGRNAQELEVNVPMGTNDKIEIAMTESISDLNEVVVLSGGEKGIEDIPGSVQYISPEELNKFSYTDINRALRTVPGVNIQEEDGFGLRPNIGLRATGVERSSKITLMEDGILMAPAPYVAPAAYYFPTMGRMQGLEIMKGSSQIKYGPYTTGGALNLISTQIPDQFSGRLNMMAGSYGTNNVHAHIGGSSEQFGYVVETFQYGSDGFKELDNGDNTGFRKSDYLGKFRFNSKKSAKVWQSLTLKVGGASENSNETYLGLTDEDFEENHVRRYYGSQMDNMKTEHFQVSLNHVLKMNEHIQLNTTVYRNDFKRNWYKLDKLTDTAGEKYSISKILEQPEVYQRQMDIIKGANTMNGEELQVKANNRSYYAQGVQMVLNHQFKTNSIEHEVLYGVRLHEDQVDRYQWVDAYQMNNGVMMLTQAGEEGTESNRIETAQALAAYINYQAKWGKWTFTPGIRYESMTLQKKDYGKNDPERTEANLKISENQVDIFLPGVGLDFKFNPYVSAFAGYHKGFAPPGTKEGTEPEQSDNFEIGTRFRKGNTNLHVTAFYNNYQNLLGADMNSSGGTGSGDLFNGGKAVSMGLEFQYGVNLLPKKSLKNWSLPLQITYTYTDAHFLTSFESEFDGWGVVEEGDQLPYLANNQFSVQLGVNYKRILFNISGRYMDAMRTTPGQGSIVAEESTDAYFVTDMSLTVQATKELSIFGSVTNLTDEVYIVSRRPAGVRPGLRRLIMAGVKANF